MSAFRFKIDEKSLYYGIYNDYIKGETATVSTPINQSKDPNKWRNDILKLIGSGLEAKNIPEILINKCSRKTTAQANSKIVALYEFNNIYLDGKKLETDSSFALYIKEETDTLIKNRQGKMVPNTHLGRQKLHYPMSLKHKSDGFNIDNMEVLTAILKQNGGFAYVVRGFDCDTEKKSINFITTIIGMKGIFLSSVFKKQKGVGKKLLLKEVNLEDIDFTAQDIYGDSTSYVLDRKKDGQDIDLFEKANKTKVENGKLGESIVLSKLSKEDNVTDIYHTSVDYPTSPYDIEYYVNGVKKYVEVKSTQGDKKIFNMSIGEIKFMERYKEDYILFLITNVRDKMPKVYMFTRDKIIQLKKEYPTTRFYA